jgi:hypothetical protein
MFNNFMSHGINNINFLSSTSEKNVVISLQFNDHTLEPFYHVPMSTVTYCKIYLVIHVVFMLDKTQIKCKVMQLK